MMADPDTLVNISELMPLPGHENPTQEHNHFKHTWHRYTVLITLLFRFKHAGHGKSIVQREAGTVWSYRQ
jgi:hypothetical protein